MADIKKPHDRCNLRCREIQSCQDRSEILFCSAWFKCVDCGDEIPDDVGGYCLTCQGKREYEAECAEEINNG